MMRLVLVLGVMLVLGVSSSHAAGPQAGGPSDQPQPPPPAASPGTTNGDWYAIAGSFKQRYQAEARANQLGFAWTVINTSECPNFARGYWIATAGPFSQAEAQSYADDAQQGAYVKRCH